jgi:hypothetical protein
MPWVFSIARVERIGEAAAADLLQQLGARRDRLRLERRGRCIGIHLRGHHAGEQLVLRHRVRGDQRSVVIERDVDRAPVAPILAAGLELTATGTGRYVGDRERLGRALRLEPQHRWVLDRRGAALRDDRPGRPSHELLMDLRLHAELLRELGRARTALPFCDRIDRDPDLARIDHFTAGPEQRPDLERLRIEAAILPPREC